MELDEIFLAFKPTSDRRRLVILGIIGDQMDLGPSVISQELTEELNKRSSIEDLYESGVPLGIRTDSDGPHDLDALSNGRTQHVNSNADECPGPDDGAGLLKNRFVLIKHYRPLFFGFFFIAGSSSSRHVIWAFSSAFESFLPGYCTENPSP